ncbi:MAG TPA: tetratricopeptide repeat protein [Xanthobacteraceae bacterium]
MNRKMRRAEGRDLDCHARFPARPPQAGAKFTSVSAIVGRRFGEAVRCQQAGQLANAIALYDGIVALNSGVPEVHNNRGAALAGLERFEDAVAAYRRAIALKPDYADAFNNLGNALCEIGKLDEAERALRRAVELRPRWAQCRTNLGLVYKHQARFADAEMAHREAIATGPGLADAYNNLGEILCCLGRLEDAEENLRHAIFLNEHYAEVYANLATTLKAQGRLDEAEAACRQAIALKPRFACAYNALGNVLFDFGRFELAEEAFRTAISLRPHFAEAFSNLGNALREQNRLDEAESAYRQAIAFKSDIAQTHYNLGSVLGEQDRLGEAGLAYRRAIALKPDFADAHNNLGGTLKYLGRFADARRSVERAMQLSPRNPLYLLNLTELKHFVIDDSDSAAMEELAQDIEALPVKQQINLHFALAKAYEDMGRCDGAARQLLAGNALKRRQIQYEEHVALEELDRIRQVFTPELMQSLEGGGDPSSAAVFIIGMPRSGTTLIEQIIASHPQVFGGGERPNLNLIASGMGASVGRPLPFPNVVPQLSKDDLQRAGARYVAEITRLAPHATRITDKMPANYRLAGLIHLLLPHARIIHAVRDPLDTCLSCFSKLFANGQYQTYDLAELGRYYRHYERVMDHWRRVLPAGRILDVRYEDVVADLASQARRMIAHCGLDWHDRCLTFHETGRPVHTASTVQVRQPIYRSAIGRARRFVPYIQPLLDALSAADGTPPAGVPLTVSGVPWR